MPASADRRQLRRITDQPQAAAVRFAQVQQLGHPVRVDHAGLVNLCRYRHKLIYVDSGIMPTRSGG